MAVSGFLADGLVFIKWNLIHYSFALPCIRLKLDPDYPIVTRFFPSLVRDTVLEWRVYGFLPLWGLFIAGVFPRWFVTAYLAFLCVQLIFRIRHFQSPLAWWKQAARESPNKMRCQIRYCEELILEIQEAYKRNERQSRIDLMEIEAFQVQRRIITLGTSTPAAPHRQSTPGLE